MNTADMKALSQKLQGPPFQAPVNMKRLDPECGGCTDLATALTGGQHLFFYKNKDSLQHLSRSSHSGSTPLAQQRGLVPWPLAIVYTSGDNCTVRHRQLSGRCYCHLSYLARKEGSQTNFTAAGAIRGENISSVIPLLSTILVSFLDMLITTAESS